MKLETMHRGPLFELVGVRLVAENFDEDRILHALQYGKLQSMDAFGALSRPMSLALFMPGAEDTTEVEAIERAARRRRGQESAADNAATESSAEMAKAAPSPSELTDAEADFFSRQAPCCGKI